jgi:hypothetical protein
MGMPHPRAPMSVASMNVLLLDGCLNRVWV